MNTVSTIPLPALRPSLFNALAEVRAVAEMASAYSTFAALQKLCRRGDGHPVMILPGFLGADGYTARLRNYLESLGYTVYPWGMGRNRGLREDTYYRLEQRLRMLAASHGKKISLVGHSLGGIYARLLASYHPDLVRQVITLGSPFNISGLEQVNSTVARLYELLNNGPAEGSVIDPERARKTPSIPSTAIYSESDGVVCWQFCTDTEGPQTENLRVLGSHTGMTVNPLIMYAISDRLAQPLGRWQPFTINGLRTLFFGKPQRRVKPCIAFDPAAPIVLRQPVTLKIKQATRKPSTRRRTPLEDIPAALLIKAQANRRQIQSSLANC